MELHEVTEYWRNGEIYELWSNGSPICFRCGTDKKTAKSGIPCSVFGQHYGQHVWKMKLKENEPMQE